jgi:D-sedoheptulose 7-phosphate isomerase
MAAVALTTDSSALTAISNDYGFDELFRRQVEALGREGDVAVGLSTSGNSPNVLQAIEHARQQGLRTVAFTGSAGGKLAAAAELCIRVPAEETSHVQELHIAIGHILCDLIELEKTTD